MKRRAALILLAASALSLGVITAPAHAVYLISETGQSLPQTNRMQRLAEHMAVASYAGAIQFSGNLAEMKQICGNPYGCAEMNTPEVFSCMTVACGAADTLYHELGHEFDERYMTDADRAWFSRRISRDTHTPIGKWEEVSATDFNGYMDLFAEFYSDCAQQMHEDGDAWPWKHDAKLCRHINTIGLARGADPAEIPLECPQGQFRWLVPACYPVRLRRS